jgi:hypothetical protein
MRRSGLHTWRYVRGRSPPSLKLWRAASLAPRRLACQPKLRRSEGWWSQPGSNRRPQPCKPSALPTELWPRRRRKLPNLPPPKERKNGTFRASGFAMVGRVGVEPTTSRLSGVRSNHLSYRPPMQGAHQSMASTGPRQPERTTRAAGGVSQLRRTSAARSEHPSKQRFDGTRFGGGDDLQDEGT